MITMVSARESLVAVQSERRKHIEWLGLDVAEIRTSDPLVNPVLATLRAPKEGWPTGRELSRLRSVANRAPANGTPRYILVAVLEPWEDVEPPKTYVKLGYDISDGTHSFLVGYGPCQEGLEAIGRLRNRHGLLDSVGDVQAAIGAITKAWHVPASDPPVPHLLFEAEVW